MRKMILAVLLAGSAASPALAQDLASPFSGFKVEGIVGYDTLRSGERDDGVDTNDNEGDESIDGVAYGLGVGYDFDLGGAVVGLEGEFSQSSGEQETDESVDAPFATRIQTGRDLYAGARIGFKAAPTTLLYAKGGYTNTKVNALYEDATDAFDFDAKVDGFRLGAGVEQMLASNAFAKVEYRYSNYQNLHLEDAAFETNIDLDRHQVVAGVGFRF